MAINVNVYFEKDDTSKVVEFEENKTLSELLDMLKVTKSEVLLTKNGEVVTEDIIVEDNDKIELLSVISGG